MGLYAVSEVTELVKDSRLTEDEKEFVFRFAVRTNDIEQTRKLVEELNQNRKESTDTMERYRAFMQPQPKWLQTVENLIISLEIYRTEEEKAIGYIVDILQEYGVKLTTEDIRVMNRQEIEAVVRQEVKVAR